MSDKRTFPEWVADFCEDAQDVVEEVAHSFSSVITTTAPLLATFASGLSVLFAVTDGVGRLLDGRLPSPYLISFFVAAMVMLGMEGTSLASVFNKDRTRAINSTRSPEQQIEEGELPLWMLLLTLLIVACTETIPVMVLWWNQKLAGSDLAFAVGLLALPLLGRAGSLIFSNSAMLDSLDGARNRRREERQERKRQRHLDKLALLREEGQIKIELSLKEQEGAAKIAAKYGEKPVLSRPKKEVETVGNKPFPPARKVVDERSVMVKMVGTYKEKGQVSNREMGRVVGVSHTLVQDYISKLASIGVLHVEGKGKDRKITVNGNHEKFLRGEI